MLPQSNGRLIRVSTDGTSEDWDLDAGAGAPRWQGAEDIYIVTKIRRSFSQGEGALVSFETMTILIDDTLTDRDGRRMEFTPGDILTYEDSYGKQYTRRIMDDTNPTLPQIPAGQTFRSLHMEDQRIGR
jgi:hypothetical protein